MWTEGAGKKDGARWSGHFGGRVGRRSEGRRAPRAPLTPTSVFSAGAGRALPCAPRSHGEYDSCWGLLGVGGRSAFAGQGLVAVVKSWPEKACQCSS